MQSKIQVMCGTLSHGWMAKECDYVLAKRFLGWRTYLWPHVLILEFIPLFGKSPNIPSLWLYPKRCEWLWNYRTRYQTKWPVCVVYFRDVIPQTSVLTSGYLSSRCLSIVSSQSVHAPLTPDTNEAFSPTQLLLTWIFSVFYVNPPDCAVVMLWKSQ